MQTELEKQIIKAVPILKNGGVVAYPTDTVYGLGACMMDTKAVDRIFQVKGRPKGMALPVLLADRLQIAEIVTSVSPAAKRLADEFFPGALTIILPKSAVVPDIITGRVEQWHSAFPITRCRWRSSRGWGSRLLVPVPISVDIRALSLPKKFDSRLVIK